jgi:hypothetical protein
MSRLGTILLSLVLVCFVGCREQPMVNDPNPPAPKTEVKKGPDGVIESKTTLPD